MRRERRPLQKSKNFCPNCGSTLPRAGRRIELPRLRDLLVVIAAVALPLLVVWALTERRACAALRTEHQKLMNLADQNARQAAALQIRLYDLKLEVDRLSALAGIAAKPAERTSD